jgi:hypothetical protein
MKSLGRLNRIPRSQRRKVERIVARWKHHGKRLTVREKDDDDGTIVEVFALEKFIHNQPSNFL